MGWGERRERNRGARSGFGVNIGHNAQVGGEGGKGSEKQQKAEYAPFSDSFWSGRRNF